MPRSRMQRLKGLAASPGVAIGKAVSIETGLGNVYRFPLAADAVEPEVERFREAVGMARRELSETREKASRKLGEELLAVFDAHELLLSDRALLDLIEQRIRDDQINAEWATLKTGEELGDRFLSIETTHLRERREDLADVTRYLLRCLQGISHHEMSELGGDVVVVAHDLTPSEAVRLGREQVVAFAIETGGLTSHTAIIARSLSLPLVVGLHGVTRLVTDQDPVIVDGVEGEVILHPSKRTLERYRARRRRLAREDRRQVETRDQRCVSRDGVAVELFANVELPEEIDDVRRYGADGVGLYRSEFLYIEKSPELPTEEDHLQIYSRFLRRLSPQPVIIRTFDLGGRKLARDLLETEEENPVLGLRGIRLTLARPQIFRLQIRALLRAGLRGDLRILLPMISSVEEVRAFRQFVAEIDEELEAEGVEHCREYRLGVMIEVPSAAQTADLLAPEVDFFSIGTNDLIQYSLAVDRNNEHVAYLYQPLHPALLRMIRFVVDSAAQAGIEVAVCGEVAADPGVAALLVGMGLRQLSLSPRMIPEIKTRIRRLSVARATEVAKECLQMSTAAEVEERLRRFLTGRKRGGR